MSRVSAVAATLLVVAAVAVTQCDPQVALPAAGQPDRPAITEEVTTVLPPVTSLPPIPREVPDYTTTTVAPVPSTVVVVPSKRRYSEQVSQWHDLALEAGWSERQWRRLQCIIARESGGYPFVVNKRNHDATGLLQIKASQHPGYDLTDPLINLRVGHDLFMVAGWRPWHFPPKSCGGDA